MRIMLVKPPRDVPGIGISDQSESLALGYLAASLRSRSHDVSLINGSLRALSTNHLSRCVAESMPNLVGITLPDSTLVNPAFRLINEMRANGFAGHITVGGQTATFHWTEILTLCPQVDSVVLNEGEETICELADTLEQGKDWRSVRGLASWRDGAPTRNKARNPIDNLDTLQFPARDDLQYSREVPEAGPVPILSGRGCHFNCAFCSTRSFYESGGRSTWRRRSVANVIDEMERVVSHWGETEFLFVDDLFLDRSGQAASYADEFTRALVERGMPITFTFSTTVDAVQGERFMHLREAGLRRVFMGAESACPELLQYFNKWFTPEHIERSVEILNDLDIDSCVSWINFTPVSKIRHLRENVSFFFDLGTDLLPGLLNRCQMYAGTPLYQRMKQSGSLTGRFPNYDYVATDPKVDVVYEVSKATFRPFLAVARKLQQIRHQLRSFQQEPGQKTSSTAAKPSGTGALPEVLSTQNAIEDIRKGLNIDAASCFRTLLDIIEAQAGSSAVVVKDSAVDDLRHQVVSCCEGWMRTLTYIDLFCLQHQRLKEPKVHPEASRST